MTQIPKILLLLICVSLQIACSSKAVYTEESFATDSPFMMKVDGQVATACESARRSLLGQGYLIDSASEDKVKGRKAYKNDASLSTFIEMNVVCVPERSGSTLFANGVLSTYALKKSGSSASVGVTAVGSISLPFGQSADSLVKISEETINDKDFYSRFFAAVNHILAGMQSGVAAAEPVSAQAVAAPAAPAIAPEPGPAAATPAITAEPVVVEAAPAIAAQTVVAATAPTIAPEAGPATVVAPEAGPATVVPAIAPEAGPGTVAPAIAPEAGPATVVPAIAPEQGPATVVPAIAPEAGPSTAAPGIAVETGPATAAPAIAPEAGPATVVPAIAPEVVPQAVAAAVVETVAPAVPPASVPAAIGDGTQLPPAQSASLQDAEPAAAATLPAATLEQRLAAAGVHTHEVSGDTKNGQVFHVGAADLGTIDKAQLQGDRRQASDELLKFFSSNASIFGIARNCAFEVVSIEGAGEAGAADGWTLGFRQIVNGVPVRDSTLTVSREGRAVDVRLYLVNPDAPDFYPANWLARETLEWRARAAIGNAGIPFSEDLVERTEFQILPQGADDSRPLPFVPVFRLHFAQAYLVQINALNGELISAGSVATGSSGQGPRS